MKAPIALFVYSRLEHTRRTVEALLQNPEIKESDLIIFSDAARSSDQQVSVSKVRDYVSGIKGFKSLKVHHRPQNFGLAKSITEGVTQVLSEFESIIVLEDDIVTSPYFLRYMNEALNFYEKDDRVISLHGYVYPVADPLPETFFFRGADCWGWATWRRGWAIFNPDGKFLLNELKQKKLLSAFDFNGAYGYSAMLKAQIKGLNDSWAVRWHASAFLENKLTLYPGRSLVNNIGNDSSGTHCVSSQVFDAKLTTEPIRLENIPIKESKAAKKTIEKFLSSKRSLIQRLINRVFTVENNNRIKTHLKEWLPPVLISTLRSFMRVGGGITFDGPFTSWEEAARHSKGYDSKKILEKVLAATLKVKGGEAAYERDSVLFEEVHYAWPVTAGLMWAAARNRGRLNVLDYGGSLGSSYFQNRMFLDGLKQVKWSVVEQSHFVSAGRTQIQDDRLRFYYNIEECLENDNPNIILLSSVLQYLDEPYSVLEKLINSNAEFMIIDRTSFLNSNVDDQFLVQNTPESTCSASYPIRFFNRASFLKWFELNGFIVLESFPSLDNLHSSASWQGILLRRSVSQ